MTVQDESVATTDMEKEVEIEDNFLNTELSTGCGKSTDDTDEENSDSSSVCDDDDENIGDGTNGTNVTSESRVDGGDANSKKESVPKRKTDVVVSKKKIGPQRQKKEIHICMKKGKKFEIRKLTRRIAVLRNLKGTEEQKAKNARKVDKLLLEIQAMKEFMMDELTERVVNIFKGTCEQIYLDIWASAQNKLDFEKMLQKISNGLDDKKYENIAFLRIVSSKDIVSKLQMVSSGMNIKKPKSKKALQKQLRKYNQKMKKMRIKQANDGENDTPRVNEIVNSNSIVNDVHQNDGGELLDRRKDEKSPNAEVKQQKNIRKLNDHSDDRKSSKKEPKPKKKVNRKNSKQPADSFFLQADGNRSDDENMSSDEEFAAPANSVNDSAPKKKNRMGQRQRKKLIEREHVKNAKAKFQNRGKGRSGLSGRRGGNDTKSKKEIDTKVEDEKLHPSWKAKQRLKTQQGISEFSGTKIVFE